MIYLICTEVTAALSRMSTGPLRAIVKSNLMGLEAPPIPDPSRLVTFFCFKTDILPTLTLTMDTLKDLDKNTQVFQLKCIVVFCQMMLQQKYT